MYFPTGKTEERGRGRGIIAGGSPGSDNNEQIEFFDIQSDGVVTVFGELASARRGCGGCSSSTRGLIGGGTATNPSPSFTSTIELITICRDGLPSRLAIRPKPQLSLKESFL